MLTLYQHPLSTYAMKVKIALREKGIPFTPILPDGMADGSAGGEFVASSPRAEIPALIDGDVQVFDSTVILEYIEDKWPEPPLRATIPAAKARTRMIEDVMDCQYEPNNWGTMEVLRAKRATGPLADKLVAFGRANIERIQRWLDGQLGDAPWFHRALRCAVAAELRVRAGDAASRIVARTRACPAGRGADHRRDVRGLREAARFPDAHRRREDPPPVPRPSSRVDDRRRWHRRRARRDREGEHPVLPTARVITAALAAHD